MIKDALLIGSFILKFYLKVLSSTILLLSVFKLFIISLVLFNVLFETLFILSLEL